MPTAFSTEKINARALPVFLCGAAAVEFGCRCCSGGAAGGRGLYWLPSDTERMLNDKVETRPSHCPSHCPSTVPPRPIHCPFTAVSLPFHCHFTALPLPLLLLTHSFHLGCVRTRTATPRFIGYTGTSCRSPPPPFCRPFTAIPRSFHRPLAAPSRFFLRLFTAFHSLSLRFCCHTAVVDRFLILAHSYQPFGGASERLCSCTLHHTEN